jgi:hypothetical protein
MNRVPLSHVLMLSSVVLLVPGAGLAAEDVALEPPPGVLLRDPGERSSPRLLGASVPELSQTASRPHPVLRVGAELGLGTVGLLGLGVGGLYTGAALCPQPRQDLERACLLETLTGAWLGSSVGFALGVWGGGALLGGQGHLLPTLGGMALGVLAGVSAFNLSGGYINAATGLALMLPYALSLAAYELSSDAVAAPPPASAPARLQPVVSIGPRGTVLGLAGRF